MGYFLIDEPAPTICGACVSRLCLAATKRHFTTYPDIKGKAFEAHINSVSREITLVMNDNSHPPTSYSFEDLGFKECNEFTCWGKVE